MYSTLEHMKIFSTLEPMKILSALEPTAIHCDGIVFFHKCSLDI